MPGKAQHPPVILYEHSLLGEGLATYLRIETGVEVALAPVRNLEAVRAVLALDPWLVIFERTESLQQIDLTQLAPHAVFIDVTSVVGPGTVSARSTVDVDRILRAIKRGVAGSCRMTTRRPIGGATVEVAATGPDRQALSQ